MKDMFKFWFIWMKPFLKGHNFSRRATVMKVIAKLELCTNKSVIKHWLYQLVFSYPMWRSRSLIVSLFGICSRESSMVTFTQEKKYLLSTNSMERYSFRYLFCLMLSEGLCGERLSKRRKWPTANEKSISRY